MPRSAAQKRAAFRAMHESGCFVLPNPWDAGSARMLAQQGFAALGTTSSGFAWSMGQPDNKVTREEVLAHLTSVCAAVDIPVNADLESGFADTPEGVAESVKLAIGTGVAGLSIEDLDGDKLYDKAMAVERFAAARKAAEAVGSDVLLVARTEGLLHDKTAVTAAIDKLVAFAAAGADCLYAPGVVRKDDIAAMVRAVAPKPVNVLVIDPSITFAEYAELGVRRVSVGGALAAVGYAATIAAAKAMKDGDFTPLAAKAPSASLNRMFGEAQG